ncbi:MAG: nickel pincer cofactor biosynthesis protein LarB [Desulfobulbaceae bacterium]|jgi:NCAIR mutase (PurE)-related protein|nr:nickel pincer cofactor biosynthesis protein LarB [Desulfobulbaceae bacterium]
MDETRLMALLLAVGNGSLPPAEAFARLRDFPASEGDGFVLDTQRRLRTGLPEVIYGAGKSAQQIIDLARRLLAAGEQVLATRVDAAKAAEALAAVPELTYDATARLLYARPIAVDESRGTIAVVCAGTSDLPVAAEAALVARGLGNPVERFADIGVAGLHRLLTRLDTLRAARVIIAVAGMEGALPGVIAGLVAAPVIAVPTSVGYGASFDGLAALLAMLNACAPGVSVVNIDNGFGAACCADAINRPHPRG